MREKERKRKREREKERKREREVIHSENVRAWIPHVHLMSSKITNVFERMFAHLFTTILQALVLSSK